MPDSNNLVINLQAEFNRRPQIIANDLKLCPTKHENVCTRERNLNFRLCEFGLASHLFGGPDFRLLFVAECPQYFGS